jgi:ABC-type nitrate/sulfonate/bicarbonate transport system permease component
VSRLGSALGRLLPFLYAFAAILAAWLFVLAVFRPHVSLLPPPALVAREFWALAVTGELFKHLGESFPVFSAGASPGSSPPARPRHGSHSPLRAHRGPTG